MISNTIKAIDAFIMEHRYNTITEDNVASLQCQWKELCNDVQVVVVGAGITGHNIVKSLTLTGVNVAYFTDKRAEQLADSIIPVYPHEKLESETKDTLVIISVMAPLGLAIDGKLERHIHSLNLPENVNVIADNYAFYALSRVMYCLATEKFNFIKCRGCDFFQDHETCNAIKKVVNEKRGYTIGNSGKVHLPILEYRLGQICSLKCQNCDEAIPYIKEPIVVDTEQVIKDIQKISRAVDFITQFVFVGGEPFLHKGLKYILNEVINTINIAYITIGTNSTILPKDDIIPTLRDPKVIIFSSSYKDTLPTAVQEQQQKFYALIKKHNINWIYKNSETAYWQERTHEYRDVDPKKLHHYFKNCAIRKTHSIFNGEFFACTNSYSGMQLARIPDYEKEHFHIHHYNDSELAQKLRVFKTLPFYEACRNCNMPFDAKLIKPAIQLAKTM